MINGYVPPSCLPTSARAARIAARFSSHEKSNEGSLANGPRMESKSSLGTWASLVHCRSAVIADPDHWQLRLTNCRVQRHHLYGVEVANVPLPLTPVSCQCSENMPNLPRGVNPVRLLDVDLYDVAVAA